MKKILVCAALVLSAGIVYCGDPGVKTKSKAGSPAVKTKKMPPIEQIQLKDADVQKFMKAFPEYMKEVSAMGPEKANPEMLLMNALKDMGKWEGFIKSQGYSNLIEFVNSSGAILTAYSCLKMDEATAKMKEESKNMAPEMQTLMKAQFSSLESQLADMRKNVPPENLQLIGKHMKQLDELLEKTAPKSGK